MAGLEEARQVEEGQVDVGKLLIKYFCMEEKKSFFASLEPKSAMLVGVVAGFLVLCAVGFVVMLIVYFGGNNKTASASNNQVATPSTDTQTPATPTVTKSDKPVVELFVMAYCPYGLQMEKAFLPAWELLKNTANFSIKFVSYSMHGKKEIDENTRQYCIQTEQPDKYDAYLNCFFTAGSNDGSEANYATCLTSAGVNVAKLNTCVSSTDNKFGITAKFNDKSTWLSGSYPLYPVNADLNDKYGVQGSPTLVINGAQAEVGRTPEAVKEAICAAFNNAPAVCAQKLSATSAVAGFGSGAGANTGTAACGN